MLGSRLALFGLFLARCDMSVAGRSSGIGMSTQQSETTVELRHNSASAKSPPKGLWGCGFEAMGMDIGRGRALPMTHREVHVPCVANLLPLQPRGLVGLGNLLGFFLIFF